MNDQGTFWLPPAHSTVAAETDALFYFIYWISVLLFVGVVAATLFFFIRYRRRKSPDYTINPHNNTLEITWTVIPTILVFVVFIWGFRGYINLSIAPKDALEIKVTAQKWFWSFDYPAGATTVNELVVPVGKPVKLLASSQDVIHCFYVPEFRVKRDVLPNRYTILWFEATAVGDYQIFCAEYCGTKHSEMLAKVRVVTDVEYNAWLDANANIGAGLAPEEFGAKLYTGKACVTCHSVDGKPGTGPTFLGVFGHEVQLADGSKIVVDENYVRESILQPQAKVVAGYQPVMPTFQGILKDREIDALIAYIKTLKK